MTLVTEQIRQKNIKLQLQFMYVLLTDSADDDNRNLTSFYIAVDISGTVNMLRVTMYNSARTDI